MFYELTLSTDFMLKSISQTFVDSTKKKMLMGFQFNEHAIARKERNETIKSSDLLGATSAKAK
jgi:hypothetical protein